MRIFVKRNRECEASDDNGRTLFKWRYPMFEVFKIRSLQLWGDGRNKRAIQEAVPNSERT